MQNFFFDEKHRILVFIKQDVATFIGCSSELALDARVPVFLFGLLIDCLKHQNSVITFRDKTRLIQKGFGVLTEIEFLERRQIGVSKIAESQNSNR